MINVKTQYHEIMHKVSDGCILDLVRFYLNFSVSSSPSQMKNISYFFKNSL